MWSEKYHSDVFRNRERIIDSLIIWTLINNSFLPTYWEPMYNQWRRHWCCSCSCVNVKFYNFQIRTHYLCNRVSFPWILGSYLWFNLDSQRQTIVRVPWLVRCHLRDPHRHPRPPHHQCQCPHQNCHLHISRTLRGSSCSRYQKYVYWTHVNGKKYIFLSILQWQFWLNTIFYHNISSVFVTILDPRSREWDLLQRGGGWGQGHRGGWHGEARSWGEPRGRSQEHQGHRDRLQTTTKVFL